MFVKTNLMRPHYDKKRSKKFTILSPDLKFIIFRDPYFSYEDQLIFYKQQVETSFVEFVLDCRSWIRNSDPVRLAERDPDEPLLHQH